VNRGLVGEMVQVYPITRGYPSSKVGSCRHRFLPLHPLRA